MKKMRKRLAALLCAATMIVSAIPIAFPEVVKANPLEGFDAKVRQVAAEGCVLVKNENNVLPLAKDTKISIFGRSQCHYDKYRVFAGSGDGVDVDSKYAVSILDALRDKNSGVKVNEDLVNTYKEWVAKKDNEYRISNDPVNPNSSAWEKRRLSQPEMPLTDEQVADAKNKSDVAVVIISRLTGEDCDAKLEKGSYYLQDAEEDMLKKVTAKFDKVVVLLNITNIMDMSWVEKYGIESVMYVWNGGQSGGAAVADVMTGVVNPSGKLADTVALSIEDYPSYKNYGGQYYANYEEDVYVGYRYFETFAPDKVLYPFGYGLSYTNFEMKSEGVEVTNDSVKVVVSVKNTGKVTGQEVVQVYYGAPQNKLGNPVKELAAFAKTGKIQPGETETLSLTFKINDMASYDDSGVTGHESCYVLEAGDYNIYLGNSVRDSKLVHTFELKEKVVEQLTEAAAPIYDFQRIKAVMKDGEIKMEKEAVPKRTETAAEIEKRVKDSIPEVLEKKDNKKHNLIEVFNGDITMEQFVAQMSDDDLASVIQGNSSGVDKYMGGSGSPFGGMVTKDGNGTTTLKKKYGIPVVTCVDGPAGARIDTTATLMPSGNVIGCTWNLELIEELFRMEGQELVANNVDNLLGPGINIHRDPRNGRNAEYYSEDPLLTGRLGAVAAKGIQESGATATGKHFACNNQERYRRYVDARVSERAMREIYLKPFEIFVKEGNGRAIMTAYNPVNGCYTAGNYDLNTTILRNEWKFDGLIMTDWWADSLRTVWAAGETWQEIERMEPDQVDLPGKCGDRPWVMVRSGGDIYMITNGKLYEDNGEAHTKIKNLFRKMEEGEVTRAEIQRSAVNVLNFVIQSQAFHRDHAEVQKKYTKFGDYAKTFYKRGEDWFKVEKAEKGNPQITGITVGGRKLSSFNPIVLEYKVYVPSGTTQFPEVKATGAEGTTVTYKAATKENPVTIVTAKEKQSTLNYRIVFTDDEGVTPVLENAVLASATDIQVNGESISGFKADTYKYIIPLDSLEKEPKITYEVPKGVTAKVEYDKTKNVATVKCVSQDQAVSYQLHLGVAPKNDEFNETELSKVWTVESENKSNWTLEDGKLTITAEKGSLFEGENNQKNQFVQPAYGDWEVVAKVDLDKIPDEDYQSIGIAVKQDDDNYIYSKIEYSGELEISYTQETSGKKVDLDSLDKSDIDKFKDSVYFKLTKLGNTYLAAVSPDGKEYIRFTKLASAEYENPKFALLAGTGGAAAEAIPARFDYVQFKTEGLGDTVKIGANTNLKVAEATPVGISATMGLNLFETKESYLTVAAPGDYTEYTIDVEKSGYYDLIASYAANTSDTQQLKMAAYIDGKTNGIQFGGGTGGAEVWKELSLGNTRLTAGSHKFRIEFVDSDVNLRHVQFKLTQEIEDAELRALVAAVKERKLSVYAEEDQTKCTEALKAAEEVLATKDDKASIDAAYKTLKEIVDALVVPGTEKPKAELADAVKEAKVTLDKGQGEYTDASWKAFEEAYKKAEAPDVDATADILTGLKEDLEAAIKCLTKKNDPYGPNPDDKNPYVPNPDDKNPYVPNPDEQTPEEKELAEAKANLDALVNEVKDIFEAGQNEYTDVSWKAFEEAYQQAANPVADATVDKYKELKENLTKAKADLKQKEKPTVPVEDEELKKAREELQKALKAAEAYTANPSEYTAESWSIFKAAYETAEKALQTEAVTVADFTQCREALIKAQGELKKAEKSDTIVIPDPPKADTTKYMEQVQVTADNTTLYVGGNSANKASIKVNPPQGAEIKNVIYTSSDTVLATVDTQGNVTAKKKGNVVIKVKVTLTNDETKEFAVNIAVKKAFIKKQSVPSKVKAGKKITLKAKAFGSSKKITWKIKSGSGCAKLTKKGKFTAIKAGKVKVQAKSGKITKNFTIRIR